MNKKKILKYWNSRASNKILKCTNDENLEKFETEFFISKIKKKTYFSLNKYVYYQLKSLGLKKIDLIDKDTYNPKNNFFSARRAIHNNQNDYGRNISVIMIK